VIGISNASHRRSIAISVALIASALGVGGIGGAGNAAAVADDDWLGVVNTYRAMSGLDPVVENSTWSAQAEAHSCYMLQNGLTHDEVPGNVGYTSGGDVAGNNGNVAVSSSISAIDRNHIDLWMTGPFHAIGILRHSLTASGFGLCTDSSTPTPWHSGGTLDVLRGLDGSIPRPSTPTVFPGAGSTVPLNAFITEFPNPMTLCGWSRSAGLPLIAMMPNDVTSATATITGPSGPIQTCPLHKGNTGADATARAILDGDNAVVVMPREVLADGEYTVTVNSNGGDVTWTFNVDHNAPLDLQPPETPDTEPETELAGFEAFAPYRHVDSRIGMGTTRLKAGKITRIEITDPESDVTAVSANFLAAAPTKVGFVTLYNCTAEIPTVSTIGYGPGDFVANQAIVPLDDGGICVYSKESVDLIIDINGFYRTGSTTGFHPVTPDRLYDSRKTPEGRLTPHEVRAIQVVDPASVVPGSAEAVALNVTAVLPSSAGFLRVFPCGPDGSSISSINFTKNAIKPNTVVTPISEEGTVCVSSIAPIDFVVDLLGYFQEDAGLDFVALEPVRLFDSRSPFPELNTETSGQRLAPGQVARLQIAGERGVPATAQAASINVTTVQALTPSFVTAYPCGPRPPTSTVNIVPSQVVSANGAMVKLSGSGELCVYASGGVHVIVDISGAWVPKVTS
jgi:hypothetical protein